MSGDKLVNDIVGNHDVRVVSQILVSIDEFERFVHGERVELLVEFVLFAGRGDLFPGSGAD